MTEYSCTTEYCEKVPSTHRPPKSSPFWWNRNVPSGNIPVPAFLPASHRFWRPVEQYRHLPQAGMNEQVTWSPTLTRVTAVTHRVDDARALVPADHRQPHRRVALLDVVVGVAQAGREELDPDLVRLRVVQFKLGDLPRLAGHAADCGSGSDAHGHPFLTTLRTTGDARFV